MHNKSQGLMLLKTASLLDGIPQHIYITSNEEIKVGDWFILNFGLEKPELLIATKENIVAIKDNCHKIILTTDPNLIKDGIQSIDDTFLKWFVKNPNCEFVEVEEVYPLTCCIQKEGKTKMNNGCMERNRCMNYKIIIPQEEPKK